MAEINIGARQCGHALLEARLARPVQHKITVRELGPPPPKLELNYR